MLSVDAVMSMVWAKEKDLFGYNYLFWITIIANLPVCLGFYILCRVMRKYEIDRDTVLTPFLIVAFDIGTIITLANLFPNFLDNLAGVVVKIICAWGWNPEPYIFSVLFFIFFAKAIIWIVNIFMFALLDRKCNKEAEEEAKLVKINEIEQPGEPDAQQLIRQLNEIDDEVKEKWNRCNSCAWNYIKAMVCKLQLLMLILIYIFAAVFPDIVGMEAYSNTQTAFLNAVTIVTLIMLFIDKSREWGAKQKN